MITVATVTINYMKKKCCFHLNREFSKSSKSVYKKILIIKVIIYFFIFIFVLLVCFCVLLLYRYFYNKKGVTFLYSSIAIIFYFLFQIWHLPMVSENQLGQGMKSTRPTLWNEIRCDNKMGSFDFVWKLGEDLIKLHIQSRYQMLQGYNGVLLL